MSLLYSLKSPLTQIGVSMDLMIVVVVELSVFYYVHLCICRVLLYFVFRSLEKLISMRFNKEIKQQHENKRNLKPC